MYLDSNVFIYACLNLEDLGRRARELLRRVESGEIMASTSVLTFDELTWAVKRHRGFDEAISAGEALVNMPKLEITPAEEAVIRSSLDLMKRYRIDPRDAIHAASALNHNIPEMVSTDDHFDRVKEIKRIPLNEI